MRAWHVAYDMENKTERKETYKNMSTTIHDDM
jgi:hypothetical protein